MRYKRNDRFHENESTTFRVKEKKITHCFTREKPNYIERNCYGKSNMIIWWNKDYSLMTIFQNCYDKRFRDVSEFSHTNENCKKGIIF